MEYQMKKIKMEYQILILIAFITFFGNLSFGQTCKNYTPSTWVNKKFSYQKRGNGSCEGFVKDKVSATRFEVVSFTFGKFKYDSKIEESIYLQTPKGFKSNLDIEAKGIPFDLDYRMNANISNKDVLNWNTGEVLLHHEKAKNYENIGVTGYIANNKNGVKKFVPLRIVDNEYNQYLFLIFRSNGSLRNIKWKTNINSNWHMESSSFEEEEPISLIFEYKKGIDEITINGINDSGTRITAKFNLQLK